MSQTSELSNELEDQMSPLEYARQNGIAVDYLNDAVRSFDNVYRLAGRDGIPGFIDNDELRALSLGLPPKIEERLTLSRDAALLLTSVTRPSNDDIHDSSLSALLDARKRRLLKLEMPLLHYDPDRACQSFRRRDNFEVSLQNVKLPMELVDEDEDGALWWPRSTHQIGTTLLQQIKDEKITVTKDAFQQLQNTLSTTWTPADDQYMWQALLVRKKKRVVKPITPPLMALERLPTQYQPTSSSEGYDVPLTSDPVDIAKFELAAIETMLMDNDAPTPVRNILREHPSFLEDNLDHGTVKMQDIYSPMASLEGSLPTLPVNRRFHKEDYKVETPLTPKMPEASPTRKIVSFANIALEYNYVGHNPSPDPDTDSKFFEEAFGAARDRVMQRCENEQLSEADATARAVVPTLDFRRPEPPWKQFEDRQKDHGLLDAQHQHIRNTLQEARVILALWPGSKQSMNAVRWAPFDVDKVRKAGNEEFEINDQTWQAYLDLDNRSFWDSAVEKWTPSRLRIVRGEDDDEEELDFAKFTHPGIPEMENLLKKRKVNMHKEEEKEVRTADMHDAQNGSLGNLLGGPFSASDSVDNFMVIRGTKKIKHGESEFFQPKTSHITTNKLATPRYEGEELSRKSPVRPTLELPVPEFIVAHDQFYIILSAAMSTSRDLVKILERTFPSLNIIERDFSSYNTTTWMQGSVQRSPVASPLAAEADVIISPCVGVIITTLQKVKSMPLPGHKGKIEIRARVEKVCLRYEKLVILVGEDNKTGTTDGLYPSDVTGLADFIGFTASLECNILVQYVAGGMQDLHKWLMAIIAHNRVQESLLSDQTHWELFLRRAGMNAFAAQAVIAMMKPPDGLDTLSPSKSGQFGLTGFVEMGRALRIARFGNVCGVRMLERVSDAIDVKWA